MADDALELPERGGDDGGHRHRKRKHRKPKEGGGDGQGVQRGAGAGAGSLRRGVSKMGQNSMRGVQRGLSTFGNKMETDRRRMLRNAMIRKQQMEKSMELLESKPEAQRTPGEMKKMKSMKTFVKKQIEKRLEGHRPYFTLFVTLLQGLILAAMMYDGPIADWGMGVTTTTANVTLFQGFTDQEVKRPQNPYYGPVVETLVGWGSKWSPCMREDQLVVDFQQDYLDTEENHGCCKDESNQNCGMMSQASCQNSYSSNFTGVGVKCSDVPECGEVILRPCCYGIYGQCAIITEDHCKSVLGKWTKEAELCEEADCLFRSCGMGYDRTDFKVSEDNPNQFHRFFTANFLHVGVIHYLMNSAGQYVLVSQVEFVAGFWRTLLMYVISGSCGFMISALLSADQVSNGSSAAIYGMLGVQTVDLFQTWQLLENKFLEVVALAIKIAIFLGIGTLPYIDNFAHVGGFFAGVVAGTGLLPFIVFGSIDGARKYFLQFVAMFSLVVLTVGLLYKFYSDGEIVCDWCKYINCVPYTDGMCDYEQADVDSG